MTIETPAQTPDDIEAVALSPKGYLLYNSDGSFTTNHEHPAADYLANLAFRAMQHVLRHEALWRPDDQQISGDMVAVSRAEDADAPEPAFIATGSTNPRLLYEGLWSTIEHPHGGFSLDDQGHARAMSYDLKTFLHDLALRRVIDQNT